MTNPICKSVLKKYKQLKWWLLRHEIEEMEDHFRWKRDSMEREFSQRQQYMGDSYKQIRYMNEHLMNLIGERAMLDPVPPILIDKDKLQ